ncbi:hypothetical protein IA57_01720 [Mangrovimonas yunxiaonensis]|uniref:Glycosyltransferase 2-like domain-containing protein n=2 Tax=Mangrovimonas yunxiaonensis TaxID=1197477 RepID=A0A084TNU0_9FLAO|nr:hypothetical protein IA57_01720 [Mangrovimonas yunxiaonensis]
MPFFSIIIPLYNKEHYVKNTIKSVLSQSFNDFEIIVVNDGSTDNSLEVIKTFKDQRISVFTTKNQGVSSARNYGIKKALANYIAFIDADDHWYGNHLENIAALINDFPNCGLYAMAYEKRYGDKVYKSKYSNIPPNKPWRKILTNYFSHNLNNAIAWTSACAVPKKILIELNGFDESITLGAGEDTDLWIRIALKYPIAFNNQVTAAHNLHAENRISNSNTSLRHFINIDKYEPFIENHQSLKAYLDLNRLSIGMQYRLNNQEEKALSFLRKIDINSLNRKQRFLLNRKGNTLKFLKRIQNLLMKFGIKLTPFH